MISLIINMINIYFNKTILSTYLIYIQRGRTVPSILPTRLLCKLKKKCKTKVIGTTEGYKIKLLLDIKGCE